MKKEEDTTPEALAPTSTELERLKYKGNQVPLVLKLAWIVLIIFVLVYMVRFAWPDLLTWLGQSS